VPGGGETADARSLLLALSWLLEQGVPVANLSLSGPPNALLERVVARAAAEGMMLVAAVGNDGPAAPPRYPAAYDAVIGVTAVDSGWTVYRRAGRGAHVRYAAPGVALRVAEPGGGTRMRSGTSMAAPFVAAMLALRLGEEAALEPARLLGLLDRHARDLGPDGRDPIYGVGVARWPGN